MSIEFSLRYNSSSLRFDLAPWQFQNMMIRPMKLDKFFFHGYLLWYGYVTYILRLVFSSAEGGIPL